MIVYLSIHAAERGWERFDLTPAKARALADRIVSKGRRVGKSSTNPRLTWVRHKRAIGLIRFTGTHALVVSLMPADWGLTEDGRGGYYATRPDQAA